MRKLRKLSFVLVVSMVLTLSMGVCAFAGSSWPGLMDFEKSDLNLAPGDSYHMPIWIIDDIADDVNIFIDGAQSKKTTIWSNFKPGWTYCDFTVAKDETAKSYKVYFYLNGDIFDAVTVHVVDPTKSDVEATRTAAIKAKMAPAANTPAAPVPATSDDALAQFYAFAAKHPDFLSAYLADHPELVAK